MVDRRNVRGNGTCAIDPRRGDIRCGGADGEKKYHRRRCLIRIRIRIRIRQPASHGVMGKGEEWIGAEF